MVYKRTITILYILYNKRKEIYKEKKGCNIMSLYVALGFIGWLLLPVYLMTPSKSNEKREDITLYQLQQEWIKAGRITQETIDREHNKIMKRK